MNKDEIGRIDVKDHYSFAADVYKRQIMPRTDQYSANRSYFSWLCGNKEYTLDARIKGGERHMIMSGEDVYKRQNF